MRSRRQRPEWRSPPENARLKKLVAELTLDNRILHDVLSRRDRGRAAAVSIWSGSDERTGGRAGPWRGRAALTGVGGDGASRPLCGFG